MDSLLPDAPDRLNLENWLAVARGGTRIARMMVVFPYHATDDGIFPLSTTSLPNPVTSAGSLFLRPAADQDMAHRHYPHRTVFIAGSGAYHSLAQGFTTAMLDRADDEWVVEQGLRALRDDGGNISFMRLILQQANGALQRVGFERDAAWRGDAYAEGSPYPPAVRRADALLGRFLAGLGELGMAEDTLLLLMPDGAARAGWHGPQQEDGWTTPFALRGPGVARGRVTGYAECIDIAHTLAALMGVPAPARDGASGRVVTELFADHDGRDPGLPERLLRFNHQQKEHLRLEGWMLVHGSVFPQLELIWMARHNRLQTKEQFWGINNIPDWPRAGSLDRMLEDNDRVLAALRAALADSGAPPLPEVGRPPWAMRG
jgi:hypothetical protein